MLCGFRFINKNFKIFLNSHFGVKDHLKGCIHVSKFGHGDLSPVGYGPLKSLKKSPFFTKKTSIADYRKTIDVKPILFDYKSVSWYLVWIYQPSWPTPI